MRISGGKRIAWALCLLAALLARGGEPAAADGLHRFELGFGVQSGWSELQEAGEGGERFALSEKPGQGPVVGLAWRLSKHTSLEFEFAGAEYESNLDGVQVGTNCAVLGLRYMLVARKGLRPYLRGAFGGAQTEVSSTDGSAKLELDGIVGLLGAGLRLATSPRLQFDLELCHGVINYQDAAVVLENVYVGSRIDKAGSVTRLQLTLRLLF